MKIEIRNRWNASLIFECEADSLRVAVELAVSKRISLRAADLRAADLSDANLRAADLSDADLSDADLRAADLRAADLRAADLSDADLSDADLRAADLRAADLSDADLRAANLRAADLRAAKEDFFKVLSAAKPEVVGLYQSLMDGKVDGSTYHGECACLVGTLANVRGVEHDAIPGLKPDSFRPAERFFLAIGKGDSPENNGVSAITVEWTREFAKANEIKLPERKVVWE